MTSPDVSHSSHGIFVAAIDEHTTNLNSAIKELVNLPPDLLIIAKDGAMMFNRTLLGMFSPIIKAVLSKMTCCDPSSTIILPDCSIVSVKALLDLIKSGFSSCIYLSYRDYMEIIDTAKLMQMDLDFKNVQGTQIPKTFFRNKSFDVSNDKNDSTKTSTLQNLITETLDKTPEKSIKNTNMQNKNIKKRKNLEEQEAKTNRNIKKVRLGRIYGSDNCNTKIVNGTEQINDGEYNKLKTDLAKSDKRGKRKDFIKQFGLTPEEFKNIIHSKMYSNSNKMSPEGLNTKVSKNGVFRNIPKSSCTPKEKSERQYENLTPESVISSLSKELTAKRCKKTIHQLSCLREEFNKSQSLSSGRAQLLSKQLSLSQKQINAWFQNQRFKSVKVQEDGLSKIIKLKGKSIDKIQEANSQIIDQINDKVQQELKEKIESDSTMVGDSLRTEKSQRETYSCSVCSRSFINNSNLRKHSYIHSSLKGMENTDSNKKAKFSKIDDSDPSRANHEESNKSNEASGNNLKDHKCNECGHSFESKIMLKFHKNGDCIAKLITERISTMKSKF